jgi:hypothetical protein
VVKQKLGNSAWDDEELGETGNNKQGKVDPSLHIKGNRDWLQGKVSDLEEVKQAKADKAAEAVAKAAATTPKEQKAPRATSLNRRTFGDHDGSLRSSFQ